MPRIAHATSLTAGCLVVWLGACMLSTEGQTEGGNTFGGSSSGGASASSSTSSTSSGAGGGSATCGVAEKLCADSCASKTDPAFGCADPLCLPCSFAHATATCDAAGKCAPACDPGFSDCDGVLSDGCETATSADPVHCGGCNGVCTNPNGTTSCVAGVCAPTCTGGFADCNGKPNDGCETDANTDLSHCGTCSAMCTNAGGTTSCDGGVCVPSCNAPFEDCNANVNDGCEADVDTDVNDCGACGNACKNPHGTTSCVSGSCVPVCAAGYDACGAPEDGCATNVKTDADNCGACGRGCSTNGAVAALICAGGLCTSTCALGSANCKLPAAPAGDDGCETDAQTNGDCGGCGNACANMMFTNNPGCDQGNNPTATCGCSSDPECKFGPGTAPTCGGGVCTCNGKTCMASEACKDPTNMVGAGGDVCTCYGGAGCAAGQSCCQKPLGCFDLQTDAASCGACGHACPPGFNCKGGLCGCGANNAVCDGGAPPGSFACASLVGADKCTCDGGVTMCAFGERCLADGSCG